MWYNNGMKLYQTIDGTMIGFYRERGGEVQAVLYEDVYEPRLVTYTRDEPIIIPGKFVIDVTTIEAHWLAERVYVQGHTERQMVWFDEYEVTRYREVPGGYEIQNIWVPAYYVTRYYWREAHPARGLEAMWIPYEHLIPAGFKDQRVWIPAHTEAYQEVIPAGEKESRVWVEGKYVTERTWVPEQQTSERVWIPPVKDTITITYQVMEEVYVGRVPVYQYVDESQVRLFEVLELVEADPAMAGAEDTIVIRNMLTGEELKTSATYLGVATRVAENEYVLP